MNKPTYNELLAYITELEKDLANQMLMNAQLRTHYLQNEVVKKVRTAKKMVLKA